MVSNSSSVRVRTWIARGSAASSFTANEATRATSRSGIPARMLGGRQAQARAIEMTEEVGRENGRGRFLTGTTAVRVARSVHEIVSESGGHIQPMRRQVHRDRPVAQESDPHRNPGEDRKKGRNLFPWPCQGGKEANGGPKPGRKVDHNETAPPLRRGRPHGRCHPTFGRRSGCCGAAR